MKKFLLPLVLILLTMSACGINTPQSSTNEAPTASNSGDYIPSPADSALTRNDVFLDSIDLLTMESFPLQFSLTLKGNLPTPCHHLKIAASQPDAENKIDIDVYSVVDPNLVCAQVLEPFDVNYPLGSYPTGHYFLFINGAQAAEFDE